MQFLDIHLEYLTDDGYLRRLVDARVPCAVSVTPLSLRDGSYPPDAFELIQELVRRPGNILGQQGRVHRCAWPHRLTDPWHESYCPWRGRIAPEALSSQGPAWGSMSTGVPASVNTL